MAKEIRELHISVPERTRPDYATEVRIVTIDVVFSDGSGTQLRPGTSIVEWPSGDLLETVKKFVRELEEK